MKIFRLLGWLRRLRRKPKRYFTYDSGWVTEYDTFVPTDKIPWHKFQLGVQDDPSSLARAVLELANRPEEEAPPLD